MAEDQKTDGPVESGGSGEPRPGPGPVPAGPAGKPADLGIRQVVLGEREFVTLIVMALLLLLGVKAKSCLLDESATFSVKGRLGGRLVELVSLRHPPLWKAERRKTSGPRLADVELVDLSGGSTFPSRVTVVVERLPAGVLSSDPQAVAVYFMANARHHRPLLHVMGWGVSSVGGRKCLRADYAYAANPKERGSEMGSHTDVPVVVRGVDLFFGVRDRGYHVSLKTHIGEFALRRRRYEALVRSVVVK